MKKNPNFKKNNKILIKWLFFINKKTFFYYFTRTKLNIDNHLFRLVNDEVSKHVAEFRDEFPNEKFLSIQERPWFVDIANFKVVGVIPVDFDWERKKKLFIDANQYV